MTTESAARISAQENRNTLYVEDARVISVQRWPEDQFVMRLAVEECARHATPGTFVHIQCDESILMRRPLSIMRANAQEGWIDILFKIIGPGLRALGQAEPGDSLSIIGPIGKGFRANPERRKRVLIGGGVGIPPMIFLAESLLEKAPGELPLVLMGSEIPFPFDVADSTLTTDWLDDDVSGAMPLLEDWGVCSRLATLAGYHGCFDGYVTDLARRHLDSLSASELNETELFSCGPTPMLKAVAALAAGYDIPCQVSLEEFMACGVGGCAGCAVEVQTDNGTAMKRVCVDGPVFTAAEVFA